MKMRWRLVAALGCLALPCFAAELPGLADIAETASGWGGQVLAQVDQSYLGWDVEIGDADNDGQNEILATGCPNSRLYLFKEVSGAWETRQLAENLAQHTPGMGLAVRVVDLNMDGTNEVILGTGQEGGGNAIFYLLQTDGTSITKRLESRPKENESGYTHNLAAYDLDKDGVLEVLSAYCGNGEIMRYDADPALSKIDARKLYQLSGSGEESLVADVDNDGAVEYITSNGFRNGQARVEIFEFDDAGEMILPPRLTVDGFEGKPCFYASILVGDVDNDGKNEMIVGWKQEQKINKTTLLAYRVGEAAEIAYAFARDSEALDMGYFEKMMAIADADNDGKNELVVSTRGDNASENITSTHLGHVFLYRVGEQNAIQETLLLNFGEAFAESSWLAVGDADNDGKNEVVLATGKGDRTQPGLSYLVSVEKQ